MVDPDTFSNFKELVEIINRSNEIQSYTFTNKLQKYLYLLRAHLKLRL